jgi:hypothetical protein
MGETELRLRLRLRLRKKKELTQRTTEVHRGTQRKPGSKSPPFGGLGG